MAGNPSTNCKHVVITGLGLVTPLGMSAWENFAALLNGRTITDRIKRLPADLEVTSLVRSLGCVSSAQHVADEAAVELAECTAREALYEAGLTSADVTCYLTSSKGAIQSYGNALAGFADGRVLERFALPLAWGPHHYLQHCLCQRLGLSVASNTVAACASSLTALHIAGNHLLHDPVESSRRAALVVSTEASLTPLFIHSYRRLGVLAPLADHGYRCLPLDERRSGFTLSEQSAAVVLQAVDVVKPGQIELVDTAIASEAYNLARPAPQMPALGLVAKRLLSGRLVGTVHPHATGTRDHDAAELASILSSMNHKPDLYACKGAIGHGLGAAGLAALVLACLCARTNRRPPMPWLDQPLEIDGYRPSKQATPPGSDGFASAPSDHGAHAVFSAGFGGHVAGALIQREPETN